ncbi:hypothetical protein V6U80_22455 [Micromonospora sp. CPCC 205543]
MPRTWPPHVQQGGGRVGQRPGAVEDGSQPTGVDQRGQRRQVLAAPPGHQRDHPLTDQRGEQQGAELPVDTLEPPSGGGLAADQHECPLPDGGAA